ncbi:alpha-amylase family glycosyl hydrolase [Eubacterium sp. 1001713B170207_170306_E7]|uniref:alpha-amylase family glycosyl hydrolase n=1 Tax=Eubacterium sp. 1001713B170207_170306_E7 TaxID=2787097 RepID=UPI0018975A83|nr:alpha-amylase family glycosyl hydrolase [Eubacterium sp. 1001713B170207_170306_E7]
MDFGDYNVYHIFTMGFAGAEEYQDQCAQTEHRLGKIENLLGYLKKLGMNTILLGPLFSSVSHGYDTTDYYTVDRRLGTNGDLTTLVERLHNNGFKVVLDCVFNHVGRDFFAFQDMKQNRENSRYKDWFLGVNFWGNNSFNDGLSYENWAGHDNLVKLNLYNPEVKDYLKEVMHFWIDTFHIDGARMDAANVMNTEFLRELSDYSKSLKQDFWFVGESVHGDYNVLVQQGHLDSVTNYEDYKGLYSSLNTKNYFEISFSLNRLFGDYGIYKNFYTFNFVDNHDVDRVASTLSCEAWLYPLYLMLYTMPGIPSIYYGSEQGAKGMKGNGTDAPLRPSYESMHFDEHCDLYQKICRMAAVRKASRALRYGDYKELFVKSQQMGFVRSFENERVYVLFNSEEAPVSVEHNELRGKFRDLYHDEIVECDGYVEIPGVSGRVLADAGCGLVIEEAVEQLADKILQETEAESTSGVAEYDQNAKKPEGLTMQDIMAKAIEEAEKGITEGEVPVGAVMMREGAIIAAAHNQKETLQDPTAHAEMLVIRAAAQKLGRWRLDDCELYVTAEPCPMCMGAVIQSRIRKLVYGTWETRFGGVETTVELGKHPMLSNATEIYSGICEEKCQELLERFFQNNR